MSGVVMNLFIVVFIQFLFIHLDFGVNIPRKKGNFLFCLLCRFYELCSNFFFCIFRSSNPVSGLFYLGAIVWFSKGTNCYSYGCYKLIPNNRHECLQTCLNHAKCNFVAHYAMRGKCHLCNGQYKVRKSCGRHYPVEIVVKGMSKSKSKSSKG